MWYWFADISKIFSVLDNPLFQNNDSQNTKFLIEQEQQSRVLYIDSTRLQFKVILLETKRSDNEERKLIKKSKKTYCKQIVTLKWLKKLTQTDRQTDIHKMIPSFASLVCLTQPQLYDRNVFKNKRLKTLLKKLRNHEWVSQQKEHHLYFKSNLTKARFVIMLKQSDTF